ncbi:uncharacterized protein EDB91DRAFT_542170 [Suillus paluster]|uniref:uncharacterized protein n=1 Tax=Suillus paluster TaxID=48578 RepID=UPI001B87486E|nr:uncharacterized protein EDB91DRAFT_542170 [Suillus paluster]KAG1735871.1 hypothetical protein EDB91DRAFT_542170 [Suillus paluster]
MDASTGACSSCASNESCFPLAVAPLLDANAMPRPLPGHASVTNGTPLPNLEQSTMNPNNSVIIMQNNHIAEGGTINIFSSHCIAVTKLERVVPTTEPTPLELPLVKQIAPLEHGRESIVLSGNSFGECVMINVGSPGCTGAGRSLNFNLAYLDEYGFTIVFIS